MDWAREGRTDADGRLEGVIQHSDAGSQYVAFRCTERLTAVGAVASIGTVGDSYRNALVETDDRLGQSIDAPIAVKRP